MKATAASSKLSHPSWPIQSDIHSPIHTISAAHPAYAHVTARVIPPIKTPNI